MLSFISLVFLFHVKSVEDAKIHSIECMCEILYKRSKQAMSKRWKILKQDITHYIEFILFHVEDVKDIKTSHDRLH